MKNEKPSVNIYSFEELLKKDDYIVYTNVGCSMLPLLRARQDIIEIRRKGPDRCKKYDVVLYKYGDKYLLHRILKVKQEGYDIAGDNNTFVEKNISEEMILGIMTRVVRNGKTITPDNAFYKLYVHVWCDAYPVRMWIIRTKRQAKRLLSKIKRRIIRCISQNKETENKDKKASSD